MTGPVPAAATWPAGDTALLVTATPGPASRGSAGPGSASATPAGLAAAIAALRLPGVLDVVPGAATVLIVTEPGSWDLAELAKRVRALPIRADPALEAAPIEIPVCYDGPDLDAVAELTGLTPGEIIERHRAPEYRVGWLGFSPGFGYLTGLDTALHDVARLATPRQRVPAGSVAIAGGLAAVYPAESPGGWRLLGRTDPRLLWDAGRVPPALLSPGRRVRFTAVTALPDRSESAATGDPGPCPPSTGPLEILRPGPLATIQDLGRPGLAHLGVPRGGAADLASFRLANQLAGNPAGAACLEFTLGRAVLRCHADLTIAVTGAPVPVTIESAGTGSDAPSGQASPPSPVPLNTAVAVPADSVLRLAAPATGLRSYLAVSGGIEVPAVLGSRSADLLSGLGPRPLRAGDRLPVGSTRQPPAAPGPGSGLASRSTEPPDPACKAVSLQIVAGPRDDWFDRAALRVLTEQTFRVTPASNRTGLRLTGPRLTRRLAGELPSEGMVSGAIQVPPDGQPILLLADHPVTGGYPVIAVVRSADVDRAAQLRPGQPVRFALDSSSDTELPANGRRKSGCRDRTCHCQLGRRMCPGCRTRSAGRVRATRCRWRQPTRSR